MAFNWANLIATALSEVGNIEQFAIDIANEVAAIAHGSGGVTKVNNAIAGATVIAAAGAQIAQGFAAGASQPETAAQGAAAATAALVMTPVAATPAP